MNHPALNTIFRIKSHGGGGHYLTVSGNMPLSNNRSLYLTTTMSSNMQYWKVVSSGNAYKIVSCADENFALNYYWIYGYGSSGPCDVYPHANNTDANVLFDMAGHYTTIVYRIKQADSRLSASEDELFITPSSWNNNATVSWETNEGGDVVQYWLFEPVSSTIPESTVYAAVTSGYSGLTSSQQEANATYIYNYLRSAGLTKNAACGILGNISAESGFNPGAWEENNNLIKGYGIIQWTPATNFINYAHNNGVIGNATASAVNTLANTNPQALMNAELDFLIYCCTTRGDFFAPVRDEMKHTEHRMTFTQYKASTLDTGTLAIVFHDHYVRSANTLASIQTNRAAPANEWYAFFD